MLFLKIFSFLIIEIEEGTGVVLPVITYFSYILHISDLKWRTAPGPL